VLSSRRPGRIAAEWPRLKTTVEVPKYWHKSTNASQKAPILLNDFPQKPPGAKLADHVSWSAAGRSTIVIIEERE
jgi:hypothetical protein